MTKHGTRSAYGNGCRCATCVTYKRTTYRAYVPAKKKIDRVPWKHVGLAFFESCDVCGTVGPAHYPFTRFGIFCSDHCPECAERGLAILKHAVGHLLATVALTAVRRIVPLLRDLEEVLKQASTVTGKKKEKKKRGVE